MNDAPGTPIKFLFIAKYRFAARVYMFYEVKATFAKDVRNLSVEDDKCLLVLLGYGRNIVRLQMQLR